jgi:hypothetical protein
MNKILILSAFLLSAPVSMATHTCCPSVLQQLAEAPQTEQMSGKKKAFKAAVIVMKGIAAGTLLGGIVERIFSNQVNYGLKYGGFFGGLIGARLAAELYSKQDPWLWHDIIHLAARLVDRVDRH